MDNKFYEILLQLQKNPIIRYEIIEPYEVMLTKLGYLKYLGRIDDENTEYLITPLGLQEMSQHQMILTTSKANEIAKNALSEAKKANEIAKIAIQANKKTNLKANLIAFFCSIISLPAAIAALIAILRSFNLF